MPAAIRYQITVQCQDADTLFHTALGLAKAQGMTVGAFNEARRRSVHEMAFDVETVLTSALGNAGCRLEQVERVVAFRSGDTLAEPRFARFADKR